ncbi:MAG: hypothetical protein A2043_10940 [Candidatus Schekmanbacteria bacterium GWA2_38_9]|nr:MAG: hypothetical protein A2043_10940 [Candidatus Schekmanbacteria bacterium GWA2_38_9]OGL49328.1 MAG: hypothetical protein A3H37_06585 [Candidatus Schekmanbacteria bacterium RIFCSPLOWO2_02_FULL_38_14]
MIIMKKETVILGLVMFVLGVLAGIVVPKYFSKKGGEEIVSSEFTGQGREEFQQVQDKSQEISQLQSILFSSPENLGARIQLGNAYFDTRQWAKAAEEYKKVLEKDSKNSDVRTDLGICYRESGDYDKAIEEFKKAAEDSPNHLNSRFNLGIVYHFDKRDYMNAKKAWEEYLKAAPSGEKSDEVKGFLQQIDKIVLGKG